MNKESKKDFLPDHPKFITPFTPGGLIDNNSKIRLKRGTDIHARIEFPALHQSQIDAYTPRHRFKAIRCGRRWGKSLLDQIVACQNAIQGQYIGIFAPEYKFISEFYSDCVGYLDEVKFSASENKGVIRTVTGGRIDLWSTENENCGRSRKYHGVIIDEAAFCKPNMFDIWQKNIRPTLTDYRGWGLVTSTPRGIDKSNFFYRICNDKDMGFVEFHRPTSTNPYIHPDEIEEYRRTYPPLVFKQEFLAEFVDWSGDAFFGSDKFLHNGEPVDWPTNCDTVFAIIDTAVKEGRKHDGTAVTFFAIDKNKHLPLIILDWDITQIQGAFLEDWLPAVFMRLEFFAKRCGARYGSLGTLIEDKTSGSILLQQCARKGWPAMSIPSKLTAAGKDERAISISGYHHQGMCKISREAYTKNITYKGSSGNHFLMQVCGFHIGVPDQDDDLFDTYCYGVSIGLGDAQGY